MRFVGTNAIGGERDRQKAPTCLGAFESGDYCGTFCFVEDHLSSYEQAGWCCGRRGEGEEDEGVRVEGKF